MALSRFRGRVSRIYSVDILGAGAGSLGIVALLFVLSPSDALQLIGALGCVAAAVGWLECGGHRRWPAFVLAALAGVPLLLPGAWMTPVMSPYKGYRRPCAFPARGWWRSDRARWPRQRGGGARASRCAMHPA
jgi:hypothetical protein